VRVLLANPYFLPFHGGIEGRMLGLAQQLARRGHEVGVVTAQLPGTAREERMHGFTVLRCPAWVWQGFPYNPPPLLTRGIGEVLQAWQPDVVDFQYRWAPEWTLAMRDWAKEHALVVTWHNAYGEGEGAAGWLSQANDAAFLRFLPSARRVVCISDAVRRDLAARGVAEERLVTIHAGFDPPPPFVAEQGEHAVFVGRLVATKGLDVLLAALARAPGMTVVLVGKGPERAALERQARALGVADRVRFAGWVPEEEKLRLVASARFVVHPARWESLGHAVAEAMLLGKPIVATDVGGLPEMVGPGGLLVPPGDPAALAEAMERLHADPLLRADMGKRAQAHALGFTWARCATLTEAAYRDALAR